MQHLFVADSPKSSHLMLSIYQKIKIQAGTKNFNLIKTSKY